MPIFVYSCVMGRTGSDAFKFFIQVDDCRLHDFVSKISNVLQITPAIKPSCLIQCKGVARTAFNNIEFFGPLNPPGNLLDVIIFSFEYIRTILFKFEVTQLTISSNPPTIYKKKSERRSQKKKNNEFSSIFMRV